MESPADGTWFSVFTNTDVWWHVYNPSTQETGASLGYTLNPVSKKTNTALTENQTLVPILCIKGLTNSFNFGIKGSDGPFWPPWALDSCVPAHTETQLQITTFRGCGDGSEVKNVF